MSREPIEWGRALEIMREKHGPATPCYSASILAKQPCPNWHLYTAEGEYICTVKWDGRVGWNGPQGRSDREQGRRIHP